MFSAADVEQMFGLKRCAAEVNGKCITLREFRYELLRYSDFLEKEELRSVVKRQVLYSLISRELLYQKALEIGVIASDLEVAETIRKDPNFKRNGRFDIDLYKETIERLGLTPQEYEAFMRKKLTASKFINFISGLVYLTDMEKEFQRKLLSTRLYGKLYIVSPKSVSLDYRPDEEELERFYKENRERFLTPEKRTYLLWKTENKEKAHSVYSSLKKGDIPAGGKEVKDLKELPEDVLRELERLSERRKFSITKVKGVYYVIYLKDIESRRIRPFSEVKDEIRDILKKEKMQEILEKKAWEIRDKLRNGEKIEIKPLEFENSGADEFVALFNMGSDDSLKLVFSKERIFGPYRTVNGFAVIEVIERRQSSEPVKNVEEAEKSLRRAKGESLINLLVEKLVDGAKIKTNEEYLR